MKRNPKQGSKRFWDDLYSTELVPCIIAAIVGVIVSVFYIILLIIYKGV